jgi:hypothetical protein
MQHVTSDNGRDIQLAVHEIAQTWIQRGFCPECVVRQIIIGVSGVAQDAGQWPADAVHEVVDHAYDLDGNRRQPRRCAVYVSNLSSGEE